MALENPSSGNGSTNPSGSQGGSTVVLERVTQRDTDSFIQSMIARYGSTENALRQIVGEQLNYRARHRRDRDKIDALSKRVPPENAVILTGDDAKAWQEFKALNLAPAKVKERLDAATKFEQEATTAKRESALDTAAGLLKLDSKPFRRMIPVDAELDIRDVQSRNAKGELEILKVPYIKDGTGDKAAFMPVEEYLKREVGEPLVNAIRVKDTTPASGTNNGTRQTNGGGQAPAGRQMPAQRSAAAPGTGSSTGDKPSTTSTVDRIQASKYLPPSKRGQAATAGSGSTTGGAQ